MLEMLGVLAIIGVLSIGSLFGYKIAMNYHRANETIHDVMLRATNVPMKWDDYQSKVKDFVFTFEDMGAYKEHNGVGYNVKVSALGPNSSSGYAFKVVVSGVPQNVCKRIIRMNPSAVDLINVGNSDTVGAAASVSDCEVSVTPKSSGIRTLMSTLGRTVTNAAGTVDMVFYFDENFKDVGSTNPDNPNDQTQCDTPCTKCQKCVNGSCVADSSKNGVACGDDTCCKDGVCGNYCGESADCDIMQKPSSCSICKQGVWTYQCDTDASECCVDGECIVREQQPVCPPTKTPQTDEDSCFTGECICPAGTKEIEAPQVAGYNGEVVTRCCSTELYGENPQVGFDPILMEYRCYDERDEQYLGSYTDGNGDEQEFYGFCQTESYEDGDDENIKILIPADDGSNRKICATKMEGCSSYNSDGTCKSCGDNAEIVIALIPPTTQRTVYCCNPLCIPPGGAGCPMKYDPIDPTYDDSCSGCPGDDFAYEVVQPWLTLCGKECVTDAHCWGKGKVHCEHRPPYYGECTNGCVPFWANDPYGENFKECYSDVDASKAGKKDGLCYNKECCPKEIQLSQNEDDKDCWNIPLEGCPTMKPDNTICTAKTDDNEEIYTGQCNKGRCDPCVIEATGEPLEASCKKFDTSKSCSCEECEDGFTPVDIFIGNNDNPSQTICCPTIDGCIQYATNSCECMECAYGFTPKDGKCEGAGACSYDYINPIEEVAADCSYIMNQLVEEIQPDCKVTGYENLKEGEELERLSPTGCGEGQYCALYYANDECSNANKLLNIGAPTMYGVCLQMNQNSGSCKAGINLTNKDFQKSDECGLNQYCALSYADKEGNTSLIGRSYGTMYGTCLPTDQNSGKLKSTVHLTREYLNPRTSCPDNYYCAVEWSKVWWEGVSPSATGQCTALSNTGAEIMYGRCLPMASNQVSCFYR